MRILRPLAVLLCAVGLVVSLDGAASLASTVPTHAVATKTAPKKKAAKKTAPDHYKVKAGVRFNDPYSRDGHPWNNVRRQIIRTINSTVRGDHIRIASWNIRGKAYTDSLIKAHQRGVSVGVLMDWGNANPKAPNPDVARMARAFKGSGNNKRKPAQRSFLIKCHSSCRHAHGIPHSKFFLFDHVGSQNWITMYGSNNATDVAAHQQWNDLYTFVNKGGVYSDFLSIFKQMKKDKNHANSFTSFNLGKTLTLNFYPYRGKGATGDPDLQRLNQIRCGGATGGTGTNGRTKVRLAQDAILGNRGIKIAQRLVQMRKRGCDIRLIYSLLGGKVRNVLKAGGVHMLQYSYDSNRDGMYDIYLHMKTIAISGNFRGKGDTQVVFNGTANWTSVALASDEVVAKIDSKRITKKYINWIDYLYDHRPSSWGPVNLAPVVVAGGGIEGRTIIEDGRPEVRKVTVPPKKVDPYAIMRQDDL